ncbi:hypothetical protein LJC37_05835 [Bacteroidales bacterium OttesenSCG-928-E04]|nr:hypothetical protein [Bacteroidales bacterium OttesenSCG-928-E04]
MKHRIKLLIFALTIFQLTKAMGQDSELDTVFVKRAIGVNEFEIDTLFIPSGRSSIQVLTGTMFLPYTDKMIGLLNNGLSPISLEIIQECDDSANPGTFDEYPKFTSITRNENILAIEVSIVANCCHNFLGEAEVVGKDTLNLVYTSYGGFCSCECCFTLRYKFDTSMEEVYQILNHVTINGSKTVGQITNQNKVVKQHIENIKTVFENYTKYQESTDSPDDKSLMTKSLKALTIVTNKDDIELLINVWMYYDPTDFLDIPEIYRILKNSKPYSLEVIKTRMDNKKEWETDGSAPYSDLKNLLKRLENE